MSATVGQQMGAGGICVSHGLYDGRRCPKCAETSARADLRQAIWDANQWLDYGQLRAFMDSVICEIEGDKP